MDNPRFSSDYLKLFLKREGKVVLGRNFSNIWLLTAVLTATFLAIAFSNGSLLFLSDKMNDPFINWVDIKNDGQDNQFSALESELSYDGNAQLYHYKGIEYGYEYWYHFFPKTGDIYEYLKCRFFDSLNSDFVEAVLGEDNVVGDMAVSSIDDIPDNSIGVIICEKALNALGYTTAPAYIDLASFSTGADSLGIETVDNRARAPLPILGVVKRLPGNADIVSSSRLYQQNRNNIHTFSLNKKHYAQSLAYFIPPDVDLIEFEEDLRSILSSHTEVSFRIDDEGFYPEDQFSYKHRVVSGEEESYAGYVRVITDSLAISYDDLRAANEELLNKYANRDVHRLYPYIYEGMPRSTGTYLSVHFNDLNVIDEFQSFVNGFGVEIEMAQIHAKENFNSVRLMAGVLSWAMIAFAIICILLFIANLLQSYFQRVKRNIGTFKAFGISNRELITVYLIIIAVMVTASMLISLAMVLLVQYMLPVLGILKDGVYNYLSLFSLKTWCAILIIFTSSLYTVYLLMSRMLKRTPGDLIYER